KVASITRMPSSNRSAAIDSSQPQFASWFAVTLHRTQVPMEKLGGVLDRFIQPWLAHPKWMRRVLQREQPGLYTSRLELRLHLRPPDLQRVLLSFDEQRR